MQKRNIVAIGFLTRDDLNTLGEGFRRHFAIDDVSNFGDLIAKLDAVSEFREMADTSELEIERRAEANANPLAPPINTRAGS